MKKRFTEAQIVGFLREADAGLPVKDLCRKHGFSEGSYYLWRSKFGGMSVSDAKRLKELETENGRLEQVPDLRARLFLHINREWKDTRDDSELLREFAHNFREQWPWPSRPEVFYDP